jgi:hypothetical protein
MAGIGLDLGFGGIFSAWDFSVGNEDPRHVFLKDFIKNKYSSKDCIALDFNIKELSEAYAYLKVQKLAKYPMPLDSQPKFVRESLSAFKNFMATKASNFYSKQTNTNTFYGAYLGDNLLPYVIKTLENVFVDGDCRNKIEEKRLDDIGSVITKEVTKQEQSILGKNFKEQYIYIGIGAGVLLLGLYVVSKK